MVLIQKVGCPAVSPSACRLIVLQDEAAKLLGRIITIRLVRHLEEVVPNLADVQLGFHIGTSIIDTMVDVKNQAEEAIDKAEVLLAVSLDISNAFNSLPCALRRYSSFTGCLPTFVVA